MQDISPSAPTRADSSSRAMRMNARHAENAAKRAAMTPAQRRAEARAATRARHRVYVQMMEHYATEAERAGDSRAAAYFRTEATRSATARPRDARPRGAGRPARRAAARSSAASDGDSDSDEPARGGLPITIIRGDAAPGDAAVARTFERVLTAQRPGTAWRVAT